MRPPACSRWRACFVKLYEKAYERRSDADQMDSKFQWGPVPLTCVMPVKVTRRPIFSISFLQKGLELRDLIARKPASNTLRTGVFPSGMGLKLPPCRPAWLPGEP